MLELIVVMIVLVAVAGALGMTIWKVVTGAVDGLFDWLILTFGNEQAVKDHERRIEARKR